MIDTPQQAPPPFVAGSAEVRKILGGVSRSRLSQIIHDHPEFPAYQELEIGRVWDRTAVKAWQQARTRPRRKAIYVLVTHYKRHGKLGAACRAARIHTTTGRRWLRDLGIATPYEKEIRP